MAHTDTAEAKAAERLMEDEATVAKWIEVLSDFESGNYAARKGARRKLYRLLALNRSRLDSPEWIDERYERDSYVPTSPALTNLPALRKSNG